ncbi:unnamed protein product [Heligmosomoides polygyrus]|uniref:Secreted protein n=1 Tax=Heligmosomoides polygyrus TaxID=6339 RepID=A0A183GL01_HELPZ|nr:unnamed protein product [Heligmosomoides polygyrus]
MSFTVWLFERCVLIDERYRGVRLDGDFRDFPAATQFIRVFAVLSCPADKSPSVSSSTAHLVPFVDARRIATDQNGSAKQHS